MASEKVTVSCGLPGALVVADTELAEDRIGMRLDGIHRHVQRGRDISLRELRRPVALIGTRLARRAALNTCVTHAM